MIDNLLELVRSTVENATKKLEEHLKNAIEIGNVIIHNVTSEINNAIEGVTIKVNKLLGTVSNVGVITSKCVTDQFEHINKLKDEVVDNVTHCVHYITDSAKTIVHEGILELNVTIEIPLRLSEKFLKCKFNPICIAGVLREAGEELLRVPERTTTLVTKIISELSSGVKNIALCKGSVVLNTINQIINIGSDVISCISTELNQPTEPTTQVNNDNEEEEEGIEEDPAQGIDF